MKRTIILLLLCVTLSSCSGLLGVKKRPENDACALRKQWWLLAGFKRFSEARELLKQNENKPGDWCVCPGSGGQCMYNYTGPNPVAELLERTKQEEQNYMYSRPKDEWIIEYKPFNDSQIAVDLTNAQKRCQANIKWVFNLHKKPTHAVSVSAFSPGQASPSRYDTKDKCDEARLNSPEELRPGLEHDRCYKKYFGAKETVKIIVTSYMTPSENNSSMVDNEIYFSSLDKCSEAVSGGYISSNHTVGRIGPIGSAERTRFIKKCSMKSVIVCGDSNDDASIATVTFDR